MASTRPLRPARPSSRAPVIGLSGSYGGLNLGDEAILTSAVQQLREAMPGAQLVVFSRDADHTRTHHDVDRVVSLLQALREEIEPEVERLDLLLLGGGGILYDREARAHLHVARIAEQLGVPAATFAIGVGPLERPTERRAVAEALNVMELVTVRDVAAKRLLEEIGVERDVTVTGDPALLIDPEPFPSDILRAEGVPEDRRLIGMSVREPGGAAPDLDEASYHALLAAAGDFAVERFDADLVFVPIERGDIREAHRVIGQMAAPDRAYVLRGSYGPRQVVGLMSHLSLALGMRLHFLVFAALAGVPFVGLPYAAKVSSFLGALGLPTPQYLHREHAGAMLASIDRAWDLREEQRRLLREHLPALKERAAETVRMIRNLLPATDREDVTGDAAAAEA